MSRDLYQEVTDKIVAQLEKGVAPWVKPWNAAGGFGFPVNASTGRPYSGINVFMLWAQSAAMGYTADRWLTFNQCKAARGSVRKGEKATMVIYWQVTKRRTRDENGEERERKIFLLKHYNVFNVAQCERLSDRVMGTVNPVAALSEGERLTAAEAFIASCNAKITHGGGRAFYRPSDDSITLPPFEAFKDAASYYGTALHELTHWTGAKGRCDRAEAFAGRFGNKAYAAEELVAEMGAAFACAGLGIGGSLQHPEYIASWLEVLKGDPKAIITAASKASAAHKYLLALQPNAAADETEEGAEVPEEVATA